MAASMAIKECIEEQGIKRDFDVEELYLANKDITEVPDLSRFKNLQILWLKGNKLRRIKGLDSNYHLTELYLQNNMLVDINGALQHLACLKVLLLQRNQLTVLTDVIHELRNILDLENLNLFGNPLTQDYDYRIYVIHTIKSLKILDRQAITKDERVKSEKKYEIIKQNIKDTIAFGRRTTTADKTCASDQPYMYNSLTISYARNDISNTNSSLKQLKNRDINDSVFADDSSFNVKEGTSTSPKGNVKEPAKRSLMQFNRFGWVDVLEARNNNSPNNNNSTVPCIYSAKFR
eukprot:gene17028-18742_t